MNPSLKPKISIVIFLLVLCILGLSMLPHDNPSTTMKDVAVDFTGIAPSSVSLFDGNGYFYPVAVSGTTYSYVVPNGDSLGVSYTASADVNNWATQSGTQYFSASQGDVFQINLSYTMQVVLNF